MQPLALVTSAERVAVPPALGRAAGLTAKEETVVGLPLAGRVDAPLTPASRTMNTPRTATATRAADRPPRLLFNFPRIISNSRRSFPPPLISSILEAPTVDRTWERNRPLHSPLQGTTPVMTLQRPTMAGASRQQGPSLYHRRHVDEPWPRSTRTGPRLHRQRNYPSRPPSGLRIHDAEVDPRSASPCTDLRERGGRADLCGRSGTPNPLGFADEHCRVGGGLSGQPTDGIGRRVGTSAAGHGQSRGGMGATPSPDRNDLGRPSGAPTGAQRDLTYP